VRDRKKKSDGKRPARGKIYSSKGMPSGSYFLQLYLISLSFHHLPIAH
jgi:hypothetical protein